MAIAVDKSSLGNNRNVPGTGQTVSFTTTQAVSANGFIVVCVAWTGDTTALSTVSGGSLSWSIDKNATGADVGTSRIAVCSAQAPSGLAGTTSVTATWPGGFTGVGLAIGGMSFTGVKTSSPLDGTPPAKQGQNAVTDWNTNSQTIVAGSVMVGLGNANTTTGTNAPVAPSLEAWEINDVPNQDVVVMEYRIESSAGSYAIAGTLSASGNVGSANAAYLAASTSQQQVPLDGVGLGRW